MKNSNTSPIMSVIVIGHKMSRQLRNTLYSLSVAYQRDISISDYEVVVVENPSEDLMGPEALDQLEGNFRYFCMKENHPSPVYALNFAFKQCKSDFIGLLIDGAHMVTPGVLKHALMAYRATREAYVLTPAYHLGREEQKISVTRGYNEAAEQQLLASIAWPENGYRLFEIGVFTAANRFGYLHPFMECNCLFSSFDSFEQIGFADTRFQYPGGGAVLLHITRKLGLRPASHLFVLAGEGSFHQFHGGVTSSRSRREEIEKFKNQLQDIWNHQFHGLRRKATLLGTIEHEAFPMLIRSAESGKQRLDSRSQKGMLQWPDDETISRTRQVLSDDPNYQEQAKREGKYWERNPISLELFESFHTKSTRRFRNQRLTGDPEKSWLDDMIFRGPFRYSAFLGCNCGYFERQWLEAGACNHLDIYDISRGVLNKTKAVLGNVRAIHPTLKQNIVYICADLNFIRLPEDRYDAILSTGCFHHLTNLEHIFEQVHKSLRKNGIFALQDYIGERRLRYSKIRLKKANDFFQKIPLHMRRGGISKIEAPPVEEMSPFEAVRSDEVTAIASSYFEKIHMGSVWALFPLNLYLDFHVMEKEAPRLVEEFFAADDKAAQDSQTPCSEGYVVFQKRK